MTGHELFRAERLPVLQNRVYPTRDEALASAVGDVVLVQNEHTGLVTNAAFDVTRMVYDAHYQNEQGLSPTFRRHLDEVLALVQPAMGGGPVLEVGCGKAYFLQHMLAAGMQATGIDPAYEGDSPHVVVAAFEPGLGISADGIILRHVLEHMANPVGFLAHLARANGGRGLIYIEVPCLDWICANRAWFDIFYEHVNYFRLRDLQRLFSHVQASGHLFGGQYIYLFADLSSLREPVATREDRLAFPDDFLAGVEVGAERAESHRGSRAIWGGSSKGVIFASYLARLGVALDAVIDINPAKRSALSYVMNPNYNDETVRQSQSRFNYVKA